MCHLYFMLFGRNKNLDFHNHHFIRIYRNHLPVPTLNEKDHVLEIELDGGDTEVTFTLDDIKTKFPKHTITATIQCGGNRRADMNKYK